MTSDHDERNCPDWLNCVQLVKIALAVEQTPENERVEDRDVSAYFLEYESDSQRGGNIFITLQDPAWMIMTRGQRNGKPYIGASPDMSIPKGKEHIQSNLTKSIEPIIFSKIELGASTLAFDIVELCKSSYISISPAEYSKLNPKELDSWSNM